METIYENKNGEYYFTKNFRTDKQDKQDKRKKLYFGDKTTHISINDIQSKVKENIESYTKWINEYVNVINQLLDDDVKLNTSNMIFDIKRTYGENNAYEDDGNTSCEGFDYNILWAFPIGDSVSDEWNIRNGFAQSYLYFTYTDEERLHDNKVGGNRFFSIYLAGIKLPSWRKEDEHIIRVDYNNNNMSLNSVLTKSNIVYIVMQMQDLQKKLKILKALDSIELFKESD